MREIKFRAYDIQSKTMVPVGCIEMFAGGDIVINDELPLHYRGKEIRVLMQFTGLKDKNGAEIYEGDIIKGDLFDYRVPTMGAVEWDNEHSCFANRNEAGLTALFRIANIEVIGNIHQNPELIR